MNAAGGTLRGLYAITDSALTPGERIFTAVESAIRGGACMLQYRDKTPERSGRERRARELLELCRDHEVPLIINDDVELAAAIRADGVHLGREDIALKEARVRLGPRAVIGVSCYDSLTRAVHAAQAGADYVAFGSFFPSPSKPDAVSAPLSLLKDARGRIDVPICAIGGITPDNAGVLLEAGANLLAVISGVFAQADIESAARRYLQLFK
jgi:thiamine-phosphate pyrophosphorylase